MIKKTFSKINTIQIIMKQSIRLLWPTRTSSKFVVMLLFFGFISTTFHAKCSIQIGDKVKLFPPSEVYSDLINPIADKGEFETTQEFEERKRTREAKSNQQNRPILVEATFDSSYAKYDADNSRFLITKGAWDSLWVNLDDALKPYKIEVGLLPKAIGLKFDRQFLGTYVAQNAMSAEAEVVKIMETVYGVFDEAIVSLSEIKAEVSLADITENIPNKWDTNLKTENKHGVKSDTVSMDIPREHAKNFKDTAKAGILIKPKPPFKAKAFDVISRPTFHNPISNNRQTFVIVADIICAVITDENSYVLKTINAR